MKYSESGLGDFEKDMEALLGCLGALLLLFLYAFVVGVIASWLFNFVLIVFHADFRIEWYHGAALFFGLKFLLTQL